MIVCVIGGDGYVGTAVCDFFSCRDDIKVRKIEQTYTNVLKGEIIDLAIVCVPTPMNEDGSCDTSIVEKVICDTDCKRFLIKSTVPPGFTAKPSTKYIDKQIAFSPEYIGEGNYVQPYWEGIPHATNMKYHNFHIFGGPRQLTSWIVSLFSRIAGPHPKYYQTDSTTAEVVKYMENSYLGMKVVFCHEFCRIARSFGVDYNEAREMWLADGRVGRANSSVFDLDKLGFGGKCIPKDINAIYKAAKDVGLDSGLLRQILITNAELRGENGTI